MYRYARRLMANTLTGQTDNMLTHAAHNFEEWHAYLSCDDEMPDWISGNDHGLCCHDCRVIVVDQA